MLAGIVGWVLEPADDPDLPPHGHDDDEHGPDGDGPTAMPRRPPGCRASEEEVTVGD